MRKVALHLTAVAIALAGAASIGHVSAAAQAAKIDITGKWMFAVETAAGSGTPTITLKQEGEKLTGHYSGQLGETDLTGTVKGQEFTFKFSVDAQGTMLDFVYAGTAESKDALKGKVTIVGLGDGTFTAKRQ